MAMVPCPNPDCTAQFPETPKRQRCPVCQYQLSPTGSHRFVGDPEPDAASPGGPASGSAPSTSSTTPSASPTSDLKAHYQRLLSAHRDGRPIVAVLGFFDSGKTFLVNRWRDILATQWRVSPPAKRGEIPISHEGLETTLLTAESRVPHYRDGLSYVIADCAGESFRIGRQSKLGGLKGESARPYLAALGLASAYVLVIPAPDLHGVEDPDLSEGRRRLLQETFDRFAEILAAIVVAQERLEDEGENAETFLKKGISGEELNRAIADADYRCRRPILVLFSQADRLGDGTDAPHYDHDPFLQIARAQPALFNRIRSFFLYYHFDYLSAFEHHAKGSTIPDYECRHFGAKEAFSWLHTWLAYGDGTYRNLIRRLFHGMAPTDWVVKARSSVDPAFRRALRAMPDRFDEEVF